MFGRFNRVQLDEDIGNWTVYRLMNINEAGNVHRRLRNSIQRGKSYGVGVEIQTVTTRPGRKYGMRKALAPPPPFPSTPLLLFPPQNKTVLIKNAHRNRTTFTLRFTVNVNEIFFPQKLRHSEIKSSRLRDRKKPPITAQSCRISKIYRDLHNAFRLFSAYENKRGMGEGPHPVDYRLGGAILLLILD